MLNQHQAATWYQDEMQPKFKICMPHWPSVSRKIPQALTPISDAV